MYEEIVGTVLWRKFICLHRYSTINVVTEVCANIVDMVASNPFMYSMTVLNKQCKVLSYMNKSLEHTCSFMQYILDIYKY